VLGGERAAFEVWFQRAEGFPVVVDAVEVKREESLVSAR